MQPFENLFKRGYVRSNMTMRGDWQAGIKKDQGNDQPLVGC